MLQSNGPNAEFKKTAKNNSKKLGLQDRGVTYVCCSDCSRKLMAFQITKNNDDLISENLNPITTKVSVACGMCGGQSYVVEIEGQFYPGSADDNMRFEPLEHTRDDCDFCFRAWRART